MKSNDISDETLELLKTLAEPLVDDLDSVVNRLARAEIERTGSAAGSQELATECMWPDPDNVNLTFTKVTGAALEGFSVKKPNWNKVLREVHVFAFETTGSFEKLQTVTAANISRGRPDKSLMDKGYNYIPGGDFSLQGMDANQAWSCMLDLARKLALSLEIDFEWRDNPKATNPGCRARMIVAESDRTTVDQESA